MFAAREICAPAARSVRSQSRFHVAALAFLLAAAVAFVGIASAPWDSSSERAQVYPAALALHISSPSLSDGSAAGDYAQPADVAELDGLVYVLDTGNNRILSQDRAGNVLQVIDGSQDGEPPYLRGAMSITTDGRYLYVANTALSQIIVLEPGGRAVQTIDLSADALAGRPPRPVGLAALPDGALLVSDVDSNRVLYYDGEGRLQWTLGSGVRASGSAGFNSPGGIAVDTAGYMYVVDILNSRVAKLSPDGSFVRQFGRPGDTAGTFSRPKDVAVDAAGNVYVSDGLLAAVQVFSADGDYLGFIGRADPSDPHSQSLFAAPAGLAVAGGKLWVVDRFAGLFAFQLSR